METNNQTQEVQKVQEYITKLLNEPLYILIQNLISGLYGNKTRHHITTHCNYVRDEYVGNKFMMFMDIRSTKDKALFSDFLKVLNSVQSYKDLNAITFRYYFSEYIYVTLYFKNRDTYQLEFDSTYNRLVIIKKLETKNLYFLSNLRGEKNVRAN